MGKLSIDLRKLVVQKVAEYWSQRTIPKHLNISRCAVQNIIKKVKEHGTIVKFGGKSIMVLGALKADGTKSLIRCPGCINFIGYEEVLKKELLPIYETHNTFQKDGALCHKSKVISCFLHKAMICMLSD